MDIKKGLLLVLILGIILIILAALACIFGYQIRELWPTTANLYESGLPYIIGMIGVMFFAIGGLFFPLRLAKKNSSK